MNETFPDELHLTPKRVAGRRRAWLLLPILLLCLAGVYTWTRPASKKTWSAEAQVMVLPHRPSVTDSLLGDVPPPPDESIETQIALIQSSEMAHRIICQLKNAEIYSHQTSETSALTPEEVQEAVHITNPLGSRILVITATVDSPRQAQDLANAVARAFVLYKEDLAKNDLRGTTKTLERETFLAGQQLDRAVQQERAFQPTTPRAERDTKAAPSQVLPLPQEYSENRRRQNIEIATAIYQQLQTALSVTLLQRDSVSGDVIIVQYAEEPKTPQS